MHNHSEIIQRFPVRKSSEQKERFLSFIIGESERLHYEAKEEAHKKIRNIVIGDPEKARVIFTAHYDTPAVSLWPNFITPRNILFYIIYQLLHVLMLLLISAGAAGLTTLLTPDGSVLPRLVLVVVYWGLLLFMMMGPANKNNHNDNTSGVAVLLDMMQKMPESARKHVAFIFFDQEEKGLQGSKYFAKQHPHIKKETLVVNLDCVGCGEHLLFIAKKAARAHNLYAAFCDSLQQAPGKFLHHLPAAGGVYPSDQAAFQCGIAVCACHKTKWLGYHIGRIHTVRDTVCDTSNLDCIANMLCDFANRIG